MTEPIDIGDDIWMKDPNIIPLFGYYKRRTFWQWLTRKPRVWVSGWFDACKEKDIEEV